MLKQLFCTLLTTLCSLVGVSSIQSKPIEKKNAAESKTTIKIGFIDYENFIVENSTDHTFSGYAVDYFNKISRYTNWEAQYIYNPIWGQIIGDEANGFMYNNGQEDVKSLLDSGAIDCVMQAQRNDARDEHYGFSELSIGEETGVLYSNLDNDDLFYGDFDYLEGKKVGMLQDSYQSESFINYMNKFYPSVTYTPQYFPNQSEVEKALTAKQVDTIAIGSLSFQSKFKVIGKYSYEPFYFMFKKGWEHEIELNKVLDLIKLEDPSFQTDLFASYYRTISSSGKANYSREEANFLKENKDKEFKISLIPNRNPISYMDDNTPKGMLVDTLNLIANETELKFTYDFTNPGQGAVNFLQTKENAILAGVSADNQAFESSAYALSNTILSGDIVFISKQKIAIDTSASLHVAVPKSYAALANYVHKNYPNFILNSTDYSTTEECLKAVMNGEEQIAMQNLYIVSPYLANPHYSDLSIIPTIVMQEKLALVCLSTNADLVTLISIINKVRGVMNDLDIQQIIIDYTITNSYTMTFFDYIYKYRVTISIMLVILVLLIVSLIIIIINRSKNAKLISAKNLQLSEAYSEAQSANVAKSRFLSNVSHEIRTPLNAIIGLSTLGKNHVTNIDSEALPYFDKIESSSKILLSLINDILDMSSIEANKLKIAHAEFDIKEVVNYLTSTYYNLCKNKGVIFNMNTNIEHETLIGDALRINQILLNLVSNAYKFTPSGGTISILVNEKYSLGQKENTTYIEFIVKDTGEGMDEDMLKRLFKPFEQENATTASKHGGSGLGLSIVKNLVDLMHGSIKVTSEKGKGSTFTVNIPLTYIANTTKNATKKDLSKIKVLVVDDDESAIEYSQYVLKRIGVQYDSAKSGKEALEKLDQAEKENSIFDLCLLDWKMPELDGIEVAKAIRAKYDEDTLIIILSAYDLEDIKQSALDAGAKEVISKPLFQSTIFNVLMNLTNQNVEVPKDKTYDFTSKRCLIVEDNAINMEIANELISNVNFTIEQATNGQQAYEMFLAHPENYYDVILMDIQMPIMDGYQATEAIRKSDHKDAKTIKIFAMTANAFSDDVSKSLLSGMDGHISKPIDINYLYKTLSDALLK